MTSTLSDAAIEAAAVAVLKTRWTKNHTCRDNWVDKDGADGPEMAAAAVDGLCDGDAKERLEEIAQAAGMIGENHPSWSNYSNAIDDGRAPEVAEIFRKAKE